MDWKIESHITTELLKITGQGIPLVARFRTFLVVPSIATFFMVLVFAFENEMKSQVETARSQLAHEH